MSVTLVLVPTTIGSNIIMGLITSVVASAVLTAENTREFEKERNTLPTPDEILITSAMHQSFSEPPVKICSQYKTIFADDKLLIKTLKEHGLQNITQNGDSIYGKLDTLDFEFFKGADGVYEMHITHNENANLKVVDDLKDEYQINAQEQSYMNIKDNLEKQNLSIETEEVLEDNSIMLTVNLE